MSGSVRASTSRGTGGPRIRLWGGHEAGDRTDFARGLCATWNRGTRTRRRRTHSILRRAEEYASGCAPYPVGVPRTAQDVTAVGNGYGASSLFVADLFPARCRAL